MNTKFIKGIKIGNYIKKIDANYQFKIGNII